MTPTRGREALEHAVEDHRCQRLRRRVRDRRGSRPSGSSPRRRGSRAGPEGRCGSSSDRSDHPCRRRGTRSGCPASWSLVPRTQVTGGWASGRRATRRHQQRGRTRLDRLGGRGPCPVEVRERHIAGGQARVAARTSSIPRWWASGVRTRSQVAEVLPVAQPPVLEGVEHELAGEAQQIEGGDDPRSACPWRGLRRIDLSAPRRRGTQSLGGDRQPCRTAAVRSRCCSGGSPVWRSSLPPGTAAARCGPDGRVGAVPSIQAVRSHTRGRRNSVPTLTRAVPGSRCSGSSTGGLGSGRCAWIGAQER